MKCVLPGDAATTTFTQPKNPGCPFLGFFYHIPEKKKDIFCNKNHPKKRQHISMPDSVASPFRTTGHFPIFPVAPKICETGYYFL
jgi:hypothetical protein